MPPADSAGAVPGGACPGRHWLALPLWKTQWGLASRGTCYPCLWFASCPLSPRPPSQREGGDLRLFYARGFAPCIPGAEPGRHWLSLPYRYPCGGLVRLVACSTCHCGTKRECLPSLSPVYTAFSFGCCPIPPFPAGRGRPRLFHARGFAPCIPGIKPLAAFTNSAMQVLRH